MNCVFCGQPVHGAYCPYGRDIMHPGCYRQFGEELAAGDSSLNRSPETQTDNQSPFLSIK